MEKVFYRCKIFKALIGYRLEVESRSFATFDWWERESTHYALSYRKACIKAEKLIDKYKNPKPKGGLCIGVVHSWD